MWHNILWGGWHTLCSTPGELKPVQKRVPASPHANGKLCQMCCADLGQLGLHPVTQNIMCCICVCTLVKAELTHKEEHNLVSFTAKLPHSPCTSSLSYRDSYRRNTQREGGVKACIHFEQNVAHTVHLLLVTETNDYFCY